MENIIATTLSNSESKYTVVTGVIFTSNQKNEFIDSFIVRDNKIVYTGSLEGSKSFLKENSISDERVSYLNFPDTRLVMPGMIDSHVHPLLGGLAMDSVKISDCTSADEIGETLKQYIKENTDKKIIFGMGYQDSQLPPKDKISPIEFLDNISQEISIVILRFDCHVYWCNSAIIKKAGITNATESPEGGVIEKDQKGELAGLFHDAAMGLVKKGFPHVSKETKVEVLEKTLQLFTSFGITGYMDAAVTLVNHDIFRTLYNSNKNIPRCSLSISAKSLFIDRDAQDDSEGSTNVVKKLKNFFDLNRTVKWEETRELML